MAVVAEAVKDGAGEGGVVVEGGGPLGGDFIGGQDDGGTFVAGADDLEEEVAAMLVEGEVAQFVEDEEVGVGVLTQSSWQTVGDHGGLQAIDDVDGVGEEDIFSGKGGGVADGGGEVGFSESGVAEEQEVFFALEEPEGEEAFDGLAWDLFGPVPVKGIEVFENGKAGGANATLGTFVVAGAGFHFNEVGEEAKVVPAFA